VRIPHYRALGRNQYAMSASSRGMAGLTTAYFLAREGKSVIVLDQGPVGGGQTGRTSAQPGQRIDDDF